MLPSRGFVPWWLSDAGRPASARVASSVSGPAVRNPSHTFTQAALSNRSKISLFDHLVGERGHPELGARLSAHPLVRATSADMLVFSFAKRVLA